MIIAEDYAEVRELYEQWFRDAGFAVMSTGTGTGAVALAESRNVDAFVMDLGMPEMDGWDAIARIRAIVGASAYILAVSAHVHNEASRKAAYEAGADDVVAKPIEPGVLVTIVRAALRTRPSTGAAR